MSIKIIVIALVALLSGIFFWQTTNRFLYPSKAALSTSPTPWPFLVPSKSVPVVGTTALSGTAASPTPNATAAGSKITPTVTTTTGGSTTPNGTCNKTKGDYNCDSKTSLADFELWRAEFVGELTTKTADGNGDGKVSLVDFELWRAVMFP